MNLSLTLFKQSATQSKGRLALISFAIALCVAMIFCFAAYTNAMMNTNAGKINFSLLSGKQLYEDSMPGEKDLQEVREKIPDNAVLAQITPGNDLQKIGTKTVRILQIQLVGNNPPELRGLTYPKPGEFYASTPLAKHLQENPELQVRYGAKYLGELPHSFTNGPDEYFVLAGSDQLLLSPTARIVTSWEKEIDSKATLLIHAILYCGLIIVLFPAALLISISAKLGNVQREQRYAALRLAGATNKQLFWIITTEALIASGIGYLTGIGIYFATHPLLTNFALTDKRLWKENISIGPWHYLGTALLTFILVYLANGWSMKRLAASPLGVARRQNFSRKPSIIRAIPLLGGIGIFLWLWFTTKKDSGDATTVYLSLAGVLLIMFGLTISSAWVTATIASFAQKISRKATSYIGWNYVKAHASQISRSVVGVVLALFAGSFFLTVISDAKVSTPRLTQEVFADATVVIAPPITASDLTPQPLAAYRSAAQSVPGVSQIRTIPGIMGMLVLPCNDGYLARDCAQLRTEIANSQPTKAENAAVGNIQRETDNPQLLAINYNTRYEPGKSLILGTDISEIAQKLAAPAEQLHEFLLLQVDSLATLDQLRTELAKRNLAAPAPEIYVSEKYSPNLSNTVVTNMTKVTYFGILATIIIALISLLVSTYASIVERRRTLLTLRLNGMSLSQIKRMILVESFAPLLVISVLATSLGIWVGWLFMQLVSTTLDTQISPIFIAVLIGSLSTALLIIYLMLGSVKKVTALSANRQE